MKYILVLLLCLAGCTDAEPPQQAAEKQPEPVAVEPTAAVADTQAVASERHRADEAWQALHLKRGQTLEKLLSPLGVDGAAIARIAALLKPYLPPNKMKIGQRFDVLVEDERLVGIHIKTGFGQSAQVP